MPAMAIFGSSNVLRIGHPRRHHIDIPGPLHPIIFHPMRLTVVSCAALRSRFVIVCTNTDEGQHNEVHPVVKCKYESLPDPMILQGHGQMASIA